MSEKFVTMVHKISGAKISGVHPDAVSAHEAIGYEVVPEKEKPIKPADEVSPAPPKLGKTVDKSAAPKSPSRRAKNK